MSYIVANLKDGVRGLLSGLNLNNVTDMNGIISRAARVVTQKASVPETMGRKTMMVYSGVYDYEAPTDIFGGTFLDFRPQGDVRNQTDYVYKKPIEQFDRTKALSSLGYLLTFEYVKGTGRMRVAQSKSPNRIMLDTMSSITDSTNWAASGNATTPVKDETVYYSIPASLRFNVTGVTTGTITKTKSSVSDLTDYEGVGVCFLATYIPTSVSGLTSLTLKIGNDSSNYFSVTVTKGFLGSWTADEWQLTAFDLANATETGSVDIEKMDYMSVVIANSAVITNLRLGGLWISLPSPHEILYQTAAFFMASGSNPSVIIVNNNDTIILNDNAYTLLEYETALGTAMNQGGSLASPIIQKLEKVLYGTPNSKTDLGLYALYRGDNPSQQVRTTGNYYDD